MKIVYVEICYAYIIELIKNKIYIIYICGACNIIKWSVTRSAGKCWAYKLCYALQLLKSYLLLQCIQISKLCSNQMCLVDWYCRVQPFINTSADDRKD